MVGKILEFTAETVDFQLQCKKVQILAHGLGTAESLVTLSKLPITSERAISHLINLAPCPIPTYYRDDDRRRMLQAEEVAVEEPPRELEGQEASEDTVEKKFRELSHNNNDELFWERTERYCTLYPDNCIANYCHWYPHRCEEFCDRFPQWCTPREVAQQC